MASSSRVPVPLRVVDRATPAPGPIAGSAHTLCEYVFGAVFIDRNGDVFACCHKAPSRYGNLHASPLRDILGSAVVHRHQQESRDGTLACFGGCNLLNFNRRATAASAVDTRSTYPRIAKLTLALSWYCNVDCVMCPQDHAERIALPIDVLRTQIDWQDVDEIICEGGEPLAAPNVQALWTHLIALGKKVNFVTNGLAITSRSADRIACHSDYVYLSFNSATASTYERVVRGGSWDRLLRSVALLKDARAAAGSPLRIIGHFTIVEENLLEVPAFLGLAADLGLDIVNFGYNRISHMGACIDEVLRNDVELRTKLARHIREAHARVGDRVIVDPSRLQYLGLVQPDDSLWGRVVFPSGM